MAKERTPYNEINRAQSRAEKEPTDIKKESAEIVERYHFSEYINAFNAMRKEVGALISKGGNPSFEKLEAAEKLIGEFIKEYPSTGYKSLSPKEREDFNKSQNWIKETLPYIDSIFAAAGIEAILAKNILPNEEQSSEKQPEEELHMIEPDEDYLTTEEEHEKNIELLHKAQAEKNQEEQ